MVSVAIRGCHQGVEEGWDLSRGRWGRKEGRSIHNEEWKKVEREEGREKRRKNIGEREEGRQEREVRERGKKN